MTLQRKKYDCPKHSAIALSAGWRLHFQSRTFLTEQLIYLLKALTQMHPMVALSRCHICSGEYSSGSNFSMLVWSQTATIALLLMSEMCFYNVVWNLEEWLLFVQSALPSPIPWLPRISNTTAPPVQQETKKRTTRSAGHIRVEQGQQVKTMKV